MKKQFPGYYRPSTAEFQQLWDNCIFMLDANVVLNVYGYSEETREALLTLLEGLAVRLRMPYQFAEEYHRNRAKAIMEQVKNYAKAEKTLCDLYKDELEPKHKHPFLSKTAINAFKRIQKDLSDSRKRHEALFSDDPYADRIAKFLKQAGPHPSNLEEIYERVKKRYSCKIPPGYADEKDKSAPASYGDCIGWLQIIEIAKTEKKPVILITDDSKEDWWQTQSDRTIGPRPELIAEFLAETGLPFYMYSSDRFMAHAKSFLQTDITKDAIDEVAQRMVERIRIALESKFGTDPKSQAAQAPSLTDATLELIKTGDLKASASTALTPEGEKEKRDLSADKASVNPSA